MRRVAFAAVALPALVVAITAAAGASPAAAGIASRRVVPAGTTADGSGARLRSPALSGTAVSLQLTEADTATPTATPTGTVENTSPATTTVTTTATSTATATPTSTATPTETPAVPADVNLIDNGDFETSVAGWSPWQARVTRVAGGHSGRFAARVAWGPAETTGDAAKSYTLDNWPGAAPNPRPGETYAAMAWVRADSGTVGKQVWLVLRAHTGDSANAEWMYSEPLVLADEWQRLGVQLTITRSDLKNVDLFVQASDGGPGDAFRVDEITMWRGTLPPDAFVTVTPGPTDRPRFQAAAPVVLNTAGE